MKIDANTLQALADLLKAVGSSPPTQQKPVGNDPMHATGYTGPKRTNGQAPLRQRYAPQPPLPAELLPGFMKRLDVKCFSDRHFSPMPMPFVRFTNSSNGHPLAHYKCAACGASQFWALSSESKAFVLFTK